MLHDRGTLDMRFTLPELESIGLLPSDVPGTLDGPAYSAALRSDIPKLDRKSCAWRCWPPSPPSDRLAVGRDQEPVVGWVSVYSGGEHRLLKTKVFAPCRWFPAWNLNHVPFVSVDHMMRIVLETGIETVLAGIAEYIEQDFRRWELFDKTPRIASHSAAGVIELMPTSDGEVYGFKYVNGHPSNMRAGLQTVTAFGVLSDVATGYPVLLSEMTILTALRTAAMSAVAARYLAPAGADTMAIIGNGAQSEFQALAFKTLLGIRQAAALRHRRGGDRQVRRKPRRQGLRDRALRRGAGCRRGGADHHHRHRRQAVRHDPDRQHGRRRGAHQRGRRRLSRQDRAAP